MANEPTILWVDDEIELLKPQILFLREKGYHIIEASNGIDAIEKCKEEVLDIVFLDEQMPGMSGIETLTDIKSVQPNIPIVMITKSEEENLMEEAIGSQISDYLIKPVKPQQVLLTLKKLLDNRRLISEKTTSAYQQQFQQIFSRISMGLNYEEWAEIYRKLIYWELELDRSKIAEMRDVLVMQKSEANTEFCKFIAKNYKSWLSKTDGDAPTLSHNLMRHKVFPYLEPGIPTFLILIDNLRFDQWKTIQPSISESFRITDEDYYYSILPTSTHYSRNAIFSGLMPLDIEKRFPNFWLNDEEEGGKNMHEQDFLSDQISRLKKNLKLSYTKITNFNDGKNLVDGIYNMLNNDLNVIVYNFVDMLSHARTEMDVLKELASDETSYRSITQSWFDHSPLHDALMRIAEKNVNLVITTDHGTIRVKEPAKVIGDRDTTTNLRYKHGKNLNYNPKDVLEVRNPHEFLLPKPHVSSSYIFAKEDKFFVYPNNYNYHVNLYRNTFQHGGISLEEMIVPVIRLTKK
ncbi:MAG: bifunctional response regulator/alkaline phosphatase family protein [Chitinophagales bacterium]|nr:bifunctional response regulator/alkaline phosphatase family protein [Chitinophagales bacterium]